MKVFQIFDGICYCDYSHNYRSAAEAAKYYSPQTVFVDAPDYVDVGWGFDGTKEGDERFIEPPAPPEPEPGPEPLPDPQADTDALLVDHEMRITMLELGV